MKTINVTFVHALEWYDGFVSGIVRSEGGSAMWAAMISFYPNKNLRTYVFIDIDQETANDILSVDSLDFLDNLWAKKFNNPFIFSGEVILGNNLLLRPAPVRLNNMLKDVKFPCVEAEIDNCLW